MSDRLITYHIRLTIGLVVFLASLVAITVIGEVDVATTGVGRVVPDGQVKAIQSFETGTVEHIAVREGARVGAGDLLLQLDTKDALADVRRLETELAIAQVEFARLKATIDYERSEPFAPPDGSPQYAVELSAQLMRNQISEIAGSLSQIDSEIREKEAFIVSTRAQIDKYKALRPLVQERESMRRQLLARDAVSRLTYLEDKERLVTLEGDLSTQESRLDEAQAALESLRERRRNTALKFRTDRLTEFVEVQRRTLTLAQEHSKAVERLRRHTIRAPIDGVVQDLTVYTVGGVVTPSDSLMTLVPLGSKLIVEAYVANKDVGFVQPGQKAEIKVTTFDYRRYGIVNGSVISVSRDAVRAGGDSATGKSQTSATRTQSDRIGELKKLNPALEEGPIFRIEVALDQAVMKIDGRDTELTSGMSVELNILTARRRIYEFFLAPFQTYQDQVFRQR
jgi:hemolysin D